MNFNAFFSVGEFDCDYVLVQNTTHKLSHTFPVKQATANEFHSVLIVTFDERSSRDNILTLTYFIILTSKQNLLPTLDQGSGGQFNAVFITPGEIHPR